MVECKNYNFDPKNPELDQLAGRFSPLRGRLGLLLCRKIDDYELFLQRCRDTAQDDRGVIMPLADNEVITFLQLIGAGKRDKVNDDLESLFQRITK